MTERLDRAGRWGGLIAKLPVHALFGRGAKWSAAGKLGYRRPYFGRRLKIGCFMIEAGKF